MAKTPKQHGTIIMIHGFRGTHHGLDLIAKQFQNYNVIVPDLPGFGEGESLGSYDIDSYIAWLHQFIAGLKLNQKPILLGHSFGSIICAGYAADFPETITKLILINPIGAPALEGPKRLLTNLAILYYWIGEKLPGKLSHHWLSATPIVMIMSITMAKTHDKKLRSYIHNQHRQYFSRFHNPESVSQSFKTSVSHNVREYAANITTPTLLIAGDIDDITPLEKQHELVNMFKNARLHVITGVGHLTHYETPDQVADAIKLFI